MPKNSWGTIDIGDEEHSVVVAVPEDYAICPKCQREITDHDEVIWIKRFGECLGCDHVHNEEIEEATR